MCFIKLPRMIFQFDLTPTQLLVYCGILSLQSKSNYTVSRAETIAKRCHVSPGTVYTAVHALEDIGLIEKVHNSKNGFKTANGYKISPLHGNFMKVKYTLFSKGLKPSQFVTYLHILSCCNQADRAFPSLSQLADRAKLCIDTVISAVKHLRSCGLLEYVHYKRKCGCFGHNNYFLGQFSPSNNVKNVAKITSETPVIPSSKSHFKKAVSLFKEGYSKFWSTILEPLKYFVRKKRKAMYI